MKSRTNRLFRNLLFTAFITALFVAAAEGVARWIVHKYPQFVVYSIGPPGSPKHLSFEKTDREGFISLLHDENKIAPDLVVHRNGNQPVHLKPTPRHAATERWYVLGASAAHGWNVFPGEEIPSLLQARLPSMEIIDAAIPAHTSNQVMVRALKIFDAHNASGVILYSGNNEFIDFYYPVSHRVAGLDLHRVIPKLERSCQLYILLRAVYQLRRSRALETPAKGRYYAKRALTDDGFCARYPFQPEPNFDRAAWETTKNRILDHYARNVETILQEAQKAGVTLLLCTVPINLNLSPCFFLPQPLSLDPDSRKQIGDLLADGWARLNDGKYEEAAALFEKAVALDPINALAYYGWGMARFKQGDRAGAVPLLQQAREHTIGYVGGLMTLNQKLHALAKKYGAHLVDLDAAYIQAYLAEPNPTHNWIIFDYCHPDKRGNRLIADLLVEKIRALPDAG